MSTKLQANLSMLSQAGNMPPTEYVQMHYDKNNWSCKSA